MKPNQTDQQSHCLNDQTDLLRTHIELFAQSVNAQLKDDPRAEYVTILYNESQVVILHDYSTTILYRYYFKYLYSINGNRESMRQNTIVQADIATEIVRNSVNRHTGKLTKY